MADTPRPLVSGDDITAKWLNATSSNADMVGMQRRPPILRFLHVIVRTTPLIDTTTISGRQYALCTKHIDEDTTENRFRVYFLNGDTRNIGDEAYAVYDYSLSKLVFFSSLSPGRPTTTFGACAHMDCDVPSVLSFYNGHNFCSTYEFGMLSPARCAAIGLSIPPTGWIQLYHDGVSGSPATNQWISDPLSYSPPGGGCTDTLYLYMIEEADGLWLYLDNMSTGVTCATAINWAFRSMFPETPYFDRREMLRVDMTRTGSGYGLIPPPGDCQFVLRPSVGYDVLNCGFVPVSMPARVWVNYTLDTGSGPVAQLLLAELSPVIGGYCSYASQAIPSCTVDEFLSPVRLGAMEVVYSGGTDELTVSAYVLGESFSFSVSASGWSAILAARTFSLVSGSGNPATTTCRSGAVIEFPSPLVVEF